jgi:hypothetical protein
MAARLSAALLTRNIFPYVSATQLCSRLSKLQCVVRLDGFDNLKKLSYFIGNRTGDLSACSIVPQPLRYSVLPLPLISE